MVKREEERERQRERQGGHNEDDRVVNHEIEKDIVRAAIGRASANSLRNSFLCLGSYRTTTTLGPSVPVRDYETSPRCPIFSVTPNT